MSTSCATVRASTKTVAKYGANWRRITPLAGVAVVVEGLNIAKRHTKPRPKPGRTERQPRIQQGGILEVPQPIPASKVMVVCPHCDAADAHQHGTAGRWPHVSHLCSNCGEPLVAREERK